MFELMVTPKRWGQAGWRTCHAFQIERVARKCDFFHFNLWLESGPTIYPLLSVRWAYEDIAVEVVQVRRLILRPLHWKAVETNGSFGTQTPAPRIAHRTSHVTKLAQGGRHITSMDEEEGWNARVGKKRSRISTVVGETKANALMEHKRESIFGKGGVHAKFLPY